MSDDDLIVRFMIGSAAAAVASLFITAAVPAVESLFGGIMLMVELAYAPVGEMYGAMLVLLPAPLQPLFFIMTGLSVLVAFSGVLRFVHGPDVVTTDTTLEVDDQDGSDDQEDSDDQETDPLDEVHRQYREGDISELELENRIDEVLVERDPELEKEIQEET